LRSLHTGEIFFIQGSLRWLVAELVMPEDETESGVRKKAAKKYDNFFIDVMSIKPIDKI